MTIISAQMILPLWVALTAEVDRQLRGALLGHSDLPANFRF
jgi:hypothetical protein